MYHSGKTPIDCGVKRSRLQVRVVVVWLKTHFWMISLTPVWIKQFYVNLTNKLIAHLWGDYAIPMALSVISLLCQLPEKLTSNPYIYMVENVHHAPELCLQVLLVEPSTLAIKLWLVNYFHIFYFS